MICIHFHEFVYLYVSMQIRMLHFLFRLYVTFDIHILHSHINIQRFYVYFWDVDEIIIQISFPNIWQPFYALHKYTIRIKIIELQLLFSFLSIFAIVGFKM